RDFPVEQYWRDNRLNMIHEGTHGIQALDLLGRKVRQNDGASYDAWVKAVNKTIHRAAGDNALAPYADTLTQHMDRLAEATLLSRQPDYSTRALANATPYMQAFGHIVIAW